jgi:UDP-2-acetamido-3-amino-2,3-dideoxy-glucuronate N-acetyltransferase
MPDEPAPDGFEAHPSATIDRGAAIGAGTRIWHYTHVMGGAHIGRNCTIGQNVFVASRAVLGDRVKVQNNVSIYDGVVLEDDVFCGPSTVFTNVRTPRSHTSRRHAYETTIVRQGATLGANSTVVCGVTIGRHAFVGAGAVVTRDVPDHALSVGNPARQVGWVCLCGVRLAGMRLTGDSVSCRECGEAFRVVAGRPGERLALAPAGLPGRGGV